MALKELMRYALDLDVDGFKRGLKEAEGATENTFDDINSTAEGSSSKFRGAGSKMGQALVAGFAAIGVGALLMQGIESAIERRAGKRILQGQFELTAEEAERYGKIAGDLYADGWGDGITEVQQAVGLAADRLEIDTDEALAGITRSVLAVSRTWGEDFDSIIRSTNQLIQNDLAPDAVAALDLIVGAFQNGGNEAGDLLDTIDEYSQHWAAMGLSGEEALNQVVHGLQNGQRDADKLADAIKEMRIRVVEDSDKIDEAYADLGLDADELRAKFLEGGDSAREAFLTVITSLRDVEDPIKRNRLAVELIGTQYEDLGPKALDSLANIDGALDVTTGKAEKLAGTVADTDWDTARREGETFLESIGNKITQEAAPALKGLNDLLGLGEQSVWEGWSLSGEQAAEVVTTSLEDVTDGINLADEAVRDANETWRDNIREAEKAEDRNRKLGSALGGLDGELRSIRSNTAGVTRETRDYSAAIAEAAARTEALQERHSRLKDELSDRKAFLDVEAAFAAIGDEADLSEKEILDLRGMVADYVADLDNIPPETLTEIDTLINTGNYLEAQRLLADLERTRTTRVNIETHYRTVGGPGAPTAQPNQGGIRHVGGRATPNEFIQPLSGEGFIPDSAGRVLSREDMSAARPSGMSGANITIPVTLQFTETITEASFARLVRESGARVGRVFADGLEEHLRSGGSPPASLERRYAKRT